MLCAVFVRIDGWTMGGERELVGTSKVGFFVSEWLCQFVGHLVVYGFGGFVVKLVGIFLFFVYTHCVSWVDYGEVEFVMVVIAVFVIVLKFGFVNVMFCFFFVDCT